MMITSRIYLKIISICDPLVPRKFRPIWEHPAGPKTVHFWAPAFKWGLVFAGIGDLKRPADHLSISQSAALSATGIVWMKYAMTITPRNWSLFSVNVFIAVTSIYQLGRILKYKFTQKEIN